MLLNQCLQSGSTSAELISEFWRRADLLVTEAGNIDDVVALLKRNGIWQAKTPAEQEGFIRHLKEEHVGPDDVGKMAAMAGVKTVVITRLPPAVDPNDDYQRYVEEAKKYFSGPIILAKDLMQFLWRRNRRLHRR
jgi:ribonuclease BN (tRNA processing enzyme)